MNKKGFTLIELLATIVLLTVIGGIAITGVISIINTSKLKSEKVFVDKISNLIDDYLDLYAKDLSETSNTLNLVGYDRNPLCSVILKHCPDSIRISDLNSNFIGQWLDSTL